MVDNINIFMSKMLVWLNTCTPEMLVCCHLGIFPLEGVAPVVVVETPNYQQWYISSGPKSR
jgi:hypothetical protein